jgi:guanylate kinase
MSRTQGKLILLIGPTGSGKSTLMKHAMATHPELTVPYSYTTRARRVDHVENEHYRFLTVDEFKQKTEAGDFLEWAEYGGNYYGTLRAEILEDLEKGMIILKEMEVQGARQVMKLLSTDELVTVYIDGGSWDELVARVVARSPITDDELEKRKVRFHDEQTFMKEASVVIKNTAGERDQAVATFSSLIESTLGVATH